MIAALGVLGEPPWSVPVLETRRLRLREPVLDDADAIFAFLSDPKVMEHSDDVPYPSLDRARLRIAGWLTRAQEGTGLQWVVTLADQVIGSCGFHAIAPRHRRAQVGFELAREHWRLGYMSEALAATLSFGFGSLGLNKIEAQTTAENGAARAFLACRGFREEGVLRAHAFWKGSFHDLCTFGLGAVEWTPPTNARTYAREQAG